MVIVGVCLYLYSDDCPHGNYNDLKKLHTADTTKSASAPKVDMKRALVAVAKRPVVWILAFQYACSFGVELQVHNVLSLFFYEDFKRDGCEPAKDASKCRLLSQTAASLISSLFGLMCLFARAAGGYASDVASRRRGMQGRIVVQCLAFAGQAISLYVFSQIRSIEGSIPSLIIFGIFVQACTGTTYGIVPYVAPQFTGVTSGIVGAGGNAGALRWGFLFKAIGIVVGHLRTSVYLWRQPRLSVTSRFYAARARFGAIIRQSVKMIRSMEALRQQSLLTKVSMVPQTTRSRLDLCISIYLSTSVVHCRDCPTSKKSHPTRVSSLGTPPRIP